MYYSAKMGRHRQNGLSFVPKEILTWVPGEVMGGLKAVAGERATTLLSLIHTVFLLLSVSFSLCIVFPSRLCSKTFRNI